MNLYQIIVNYCYIHYTSLIPHTQQISKVAYCVYMKILNEETTQYWHFCNVLKQCNLKLF